MKINGILQECIYLQTIYQILAVIHVISAILGMGPGFYLTLVASKAKTMTELRYAYDIRQRLHIFVMIGGFLLLATGLCMGFIRPALFTAFWYIASLTLYLIALAFGPFVLKPLTKPIKTLLYEDHNTIPPQYMKLAEKLFRYEWITNVIFFIIILLMLTKPTF